MLRSNEDQETMNNLPQVIKERFQRFQLAYHVRLINKYEHILLGGFHIEEGVYGPRYYYPDIGRIGEPPRRWETEMPGDTILVHLKASTDTIEKRMEVAPHLFPVVLKADVQEILEEFQREYRETWIKRKFEIDTTDLTPEELMEAFLAESTSHLNTRDMLIRNV